MKGIRSDSRLSMLVLVGTLVSSVTKWELATASVIVRNSNRIPLEQVDAGTLAPFHVGSITFQKGRYVAIGSRRFYTHKPSTSPSVIAVSDDAKTWTLTHTNRFGLKALATDGEHIVAVGDYGAILISSDGYDWQQGNSLGTKYLKSVAFGGGLWVAVGDDGAIVTSRDGIEWVVRDDPQYAQMHLHLTSITYGAGRFVAVGGEHAGRSVSSTDGINWTPGRFTESVFTANPPLEGDRATTVLRGVAYGNGRFVTGGGRGRTFVSINGVEWVRSTAQDADWNLNGVNYVRGRFLATANNGLLSSRDGFHWIRDSEFPAFDERFREVVFAKGGYVGIGYFGLILQSISSKPIIDAVSETATTVLLSFSGASADRYAVEAAPSLVSPTWTRIGEVAAPNGEGMFEDFETSNTTSRFYRLVEQ